MGEKNSLFRSKYTKEEEITLLQEFRRFREILLQKNQTKWVEFRKFSTVRPGSFTHEQLFSKIRALEEKYNRNRKKCSVPTHPHHARVFELSKSIWGDESRELLVEELELFLQTLLLEHKKQKLRLQRLKSEMNQTVEKDTSTNKNQGSTHEDQEEEEEEEEEKKEEVLHCTKTDLLPKSSENDKMEAGDQNQPSSETEMIVHDDDLPVYEKVVDDGKRSGKNKSKRKKRKAAEELAEGDGNGKLASRGRMVRMQ